MGPVTSVEASAVTQLSSSSIDVLVGFASVVVRAWEEGSSFSWGVLGFLRFLDFLSPLKASGLTMSAEMLQSCTVGCMQINGGIVSEDSAKSRYELAGPAESGEFSVG